MTVLPIVPQGIGRHAPTILRALLLLQGFPTILWVLLLPQEAPSTSPSPSPAWLSSSLMGSPRSLGPSSSLRKPLNIAGDLVGVQFGKVYV